MFVDPELRGHLGNETANNSVKHVFRYKPN